MPDIKLKKELGFIEVFSIASGAMISSGLFILPAIVYQKAGPGIILSYLLASVFIIPAMLANAELATAMPKSGGSYFFINRSLGSLFGTFAGFASWFSLSLKSAFALLGIGIFVAPFVPFFPQELIIKAVALVFVLIFTLLNIISVKESSKYQVILVLGLVAILIFYIIYNLPLINVDYFKPEKDYGWFSVFGVTGMIFVSFVGLTKIASLAEEVRNPRQNIPRGMFAAFAVVTLLYVLAVFTTVGILPSAAFQATELPLSTGAKLSLGSFGYYLLAIAALLAFITTGNAGIMAASRDPLAMARDSLIPQFFARVSVKRKTPVIALIFTSGFMLVSIIFLDIENLVKVASTMMLILFSLINISVILMRESKIISYRPTFKVPLYPFINIAGAILYILLIIEMGAVPLIISLGFFGFALLWYLLFSRSRVNRDSALIRIVEHIISQSINSNTLSDELREILAERDQIVDDRFDRIIKEAEIIDIPGEIGLEELFRLIAVSFARKFGIPSEEIFELLKKREASSSTVISTGLAIPHIVLESTTKFDIIVLRSKAGIRFSEALPLVNVIFALAGALDERNFHLQALMAIAQIIHNQDFQHKWMKTKTTADLRNLILLTQRVRKAEL